MSVWVCRKDMQKYIWHCRQLANKSLTKAEIKTDEHVCVGAALVQPGQGGQRCKHPSWMTPSDHRGAAETIVSEILSWLVFHHSKSLNCDLLLLLFYNRPCWHSLIM